MRLADFHVSGYAPLQHGGYIAKGFALQLRASQRAVRVLDRLTGPGQLGHWVIDPDSVGDIHGGQLLTRLSVDARDIHMWRYATPAIVIKGGGGGTATPGGGTPAAGLDPSLLLPGAPTPTQGGTGSTTASGCGIDSGPLAALPINGSIYDLDNRFQPLRFPRLAVDGKPSWPKFVRGAVGISLVGNFENQQSDIWHSTDPRLFAPQKAGDPEMGTPLCDLKPDFGVDPDRQSPLQAMMWVIKRPLGNANSIAWNLGMTGCKDREGGLVIDNSPAVGHFTTVTQSERKVVAFASRRRGGPLDVGDGFCRHVLGADADGNPVSKLHISSDFLLRKNNAFDGPLRVEGLIFGDIIEYPQKVNAHMVFDPAKGDWKWVASCYVVYAPPDVPT